MIHNFICNFHNTEGNLQYGHAINANGHFSTCLYYFSKFQFQNLTNKIEFRTHPYINVAKMFFIFICEIFNIVDHTRISNFTISMCIKLHIHLC